MSQFLEQPGLFDQVIRLEESEKKEPMTVLERFFGDYRLHECRHHLWAMVQACLTTDNAEFDDPAERADLLLRYQHLEELLEAAWLLTSRKQTPACGEN